MNLAARLENRGPGASAPTLFVLPPSPQRPLLHMPIIIVSRPPRHDFRQRAESRRAASNPPEDRECRATERVLGAVR